MSNTCTSEISCTGTHVSFRQQLRQNVRIAYHALDRMYVLMAKAEKLMYRITLRIGFDMFGIKMEAGRLKTRV